MVTLPVGILPVGILLTVTLLTVHIPQETTNPVTVILRKSRVFLGLNVNTYI